MAAKSVAVQGDVSATPGQAFYTGATSGTWTKMGEVTETSYPSLASGGKEVIWKASCSFSFTGKNDAGTAITGTETVTLTATTKLLNKGQNDVLVDGDSQTGGDTPPTFDNQLSVSASGPLKTS